MSSLADTRHKLGEDNGGFRKFILRGDGNWEKETLAYGFMVENACDGVYRLRAWLVMKLWPARLTSDKVARGAIHEHR